MTEKVFCRRGDSPKKPYNYKGCGLDNIYLLSGFDIIKDEDGNSVIIHNMDSLHRAIAKQLVMEQKVLSGKEIRFLRTYLDLSQSDLGKLLGCDSQSVARYEKEQCDIPSPTERLLRMMVLGHMMGKIDVREVVQRIETMEGKDSAKLKFASTSKGWKVA
ncbi:MAG: hypothetical protein WC464_02255 [Bdellovibrionales bacterium]